MTHPMTRSVIREGGGNARSLFLRVVTNYLSDTQSNIASKMGISASYLNDLMHGRRDWSPSLLDRYAAANDSRSALPELHALAAKAAGWRIP